MSDRLKRTKSESQKCERKAHLGGNTGACSREAAQASVLAGIACGLVDGAYIAVGEEAARAVGAAQGLDVNQLQPSR